MQNAGKFSMEDIQLYYIYCVQYIKMLPCPVSLILENWVNQICHCPIYSSGIYQQNYQLLAIAFVTLECNKIMILYQINLLSTCIHIHTHVTFNNSIPILCRLFTPIKYKEYFLLGCNAIQFGRNAPTLIMEAR